jgi:putative colanic acid biosynthesis acetyltransferase WcaF
MAYETKFMSEQPVRIVSQDGRAQPNPYAASERLLRAVWLCCYWSVFRWVPRFLNGWHRMVLRTFGARVGSDVLIYPSALIDCPWNLELADNCVIGAGVRLYALGKISLGAHTVVSQRAHLCAGSHDYLDPRMPLLRPPITVGRGVWICTEAFIGPGASIGARAVIGARSVVTGDIPEDMVCAGNPCRPLKRRVGRQP